MRCWGWRWGASIVVEFMNRGKIKIWSSWRTVHRLFDRKFMQWITLWINRTSKNFCFMIFDTFSNWIIFFFHHFILFSCDESFLFRTIFLHSFHDWLTTMKKKRKKKDGGKRRGNWWLIQESRKSMNEKIGTARIELNWYLLSLSSLPVTSSWSSWSFISSNLMSSKSLS